MIGKKTYSDTSMSTYVNSIASTQVSSSPDSSMMNMSSATKRLATRAVITGLGSAAFSVFYLGVPFTTATVKNAALVSGSYTLGELATRYLIPRVLHTKAKSPVNMLTESAINMLVKKSGQVPQLSNVLGACGINGSRWSVYLDQ